MKNRKNYKKLLILLSAALLIGVLCLLAFVERSAPDSTIRTPWDAFWYFIVTITTVGYGDMAPMTPVGQALGLIFVLLSCGLISVILTTTIRVLTGSRILYIRIASARVSKWYIFDGDTAENIHLAGQLAELRENAGIIFCETDRITPSLLAFRHIYTPLSVEEAAHLSMKNSNARSGELPGIFLTGDDEEKNLKTALEILSTGKKAEIYCRCSVRFDVPPDGLHTFDTSDLTARTYWANHPLAFPEQCIVLIGSGHNLDYLIEQAMLVNSFGPLLRCRYHIFEEPGREPSEFLADHPCIGDVIRVMTDVTSDSWQLEDLSSCDALLFHKGTWHTDYECLALADRIIVCGDSEIDNIRTAEKIRLLAPVRAAIHICGSASIDGTIGFGSPEEIYTPKLILKEELLRRAMALNDYYNAVQPDPKKRTNWEDLPAFTRRSNIAAADHMVTKFRILTGNLANKEPVKAYPAGVRLAIKKFSEEKVDRILCRRIEHERWMRFHSLYGWTYGPVRDNDRRYHPMMVPFEDLTPDEQALDDISWELLRVLL